MLQGFTVPLSPQGEANLASAPPWHYAGDVLAVEFWRKDHSAIARGWVQGPEEAGLGPPDQGVRGGQQVADVWTGSGELGLFPARGEELADLAPLRTGRGFRAAMCYTVTEVRDLTA